MESQFLYLHVNILNWLNGPYVEQFKTFGPLLSTIWRFCWNIGDVYLRFDKYVFVTQMQIITFENMTDETCMC